MTRPPHLDVELALDRVDKLIGSGQWRDALDVLDKAKDLSGARPLLLRALTELSDPRRTITMLWPPLTIAEAVTVGGAILESGTSAEAKAFIELALVSGSTDASIGDISRRIRQRRLR